MSLCTTIKGIAGEDLTGAERKPVYFDTADGGRVKLVAANDARVDGLLVVGAADDAEVSVCIHGHAEAIAGGALDNGDELMWATGGKSVVATSGDNAFARFVGGVKGGAPATIADGVTVPVYVFDRYHTVA